MGHVACEKPHIVVSVAALLFELAARLGRITLCSGHTSRPPCLDRPPDYSVTEDMSKTPSAFVQKVFRRRRSKARPIQACTWHCLPVAHRAPSSLCHAYFEAVRDLPGNFMLLKSPARAGEWARHGCAHPQAGRQSFRSTCTDHLSPRRFECPSTGLDWSDSPPAMIMYRSDELGRGGQAGITAGDDTAGGDQTRTRACADPDQCEKLHITCATTTAAASQTALGAWCLFCQGRCSLAVAWVRCAGLYNRTCFCCSLFSRCYLPHRLGSRNIAYSSTCLAEHSITKDGPCSTCK